MIKNETKNTVETITETLNDLAYDIALLKSELQGCEVQSNYERAFRELLNKEVELAVFKDINGLV